MKAQGKHMPTLYGVMLMAIFAMAAFYISTFGWVERLSISPLIVGIIIGMVYANSLRNRLPETWVPGIKLCTKQILRWGIILYGFRLTLQEVLLVGGPAILIDAIIVCGTMGVGILAGKLLGMDRDTTLMVSTGSSICGAAAVLGAEPVVKCAPYKTAIAVSTVVIFGTLSMFLYPVLYRTGVFSLTDSQMAIYAGSTLHEVAHVVGAGNAMDPDGALSIAGTATITKMIRVMMLVPLLVVMGFLLSRSRARSSAGGRSKITVPWFAFGFILVICINSAMLPVFPAEFMDAFSDTVKGIDNFMLTMAMTALGAETGFDKFKKAGAKPFCLAAIIYVWLVFGGYYLTKLLVA